MRRRVPAVPAPFLGGGRDPGPELSVRLPQASRSPGLLAAARVDEGSAEPVPAPSCSGARQLRFVLPGRPSAAACGYAPRGGNCCEGVCFTASGARGVPAALSVLCCAVIAALRTLFSHPSRAAAATRCLTPPGQLGCRGCALPWWCFSHTESRCG